MNMQLTNVRQLAAASTRTIATMAKPTFRAAVDAVRSATREYARSSEAAAASAVACRAVEAEHLPSDAAIHLAGDNVPVPAILKRPRAPSGRDVIKVTMERLDGTASVLDYTTPDNEDRAMSYGELAEYYKDAPTTLTEAQHIYKQWQFDRAKAGRDLIPAIVREARSATMPAYEGRATARRARDAACEGLLMLEAGRPSDELLRIRTLLEAYGAHLTRAGGVANFDDILDEHPRMASRIFKLMLDGWRHAETTEAQAATDTAMAEYVAAKSLDAHLAHHGDPDGCDHDDRLSKAEDALLATSPADLAGVSARLGAIIGFAWSEPHGDWDCPLCPEKREKTLAATRPPAAAELYNPADEEDRDDALFRALVVLQRGIDRSPGSNAAARLAPHQRQSAAA